MEKRVYQKNKKGADITDNNAKLLKILIGIILFSCAFIFCFNKLCIDNGKIARNINIEGVKVSGLTKEEAISELESKYQPHDTNLNYKGEEFTIAPENIELKYETKEAVEKAYNYTKQDSLLKNIKTYLVTMKDGKNFDITSKYDEAKLSKEIEGLSNKINIEVKDAKVHIDGNGNISVTPSVVGKEMDMPYNKEKIYEAIKKKSSDPIDIKVVDKKPQVSTQQAEAVNTLLGEYSTKFSMSQSGRANNVIKAANSTSNVLLMPGDEFSYNTLTGPRIKSNGYKDAPVIVKGKIEQESGGGVCQTSSTLYNAVLFSGLEITEIQNHSLKSKYIPVGRDAMVSYGGSDFRFKNNYNHPVYVKNFAGNGYVTCRIYGNGQDKKNIAIRVDQFKSGGLDAAKTYRQYKDMNGSISKTEFIDTSVYKKPKK